MKVLTFQPSYVLEAHSVMSRQRPIKRTPPWQISINLTIASRARTALMALSHPLSMVATNKLLKNVSLVLSVEKEATLQMVKVNVRRAFTALKVRIS